MKSTRLNWLANHGRHQDNRRSRIKRGPHPWKDGKVGSSTIDLPIVEPAGRD